MANKYRRRFSAAARVTGAIGDVVKVIKGNESKDSKSLRATRILDKRNRLVAPAINSIKATGFRVRSLEEVILLAKN